MSVAKALHKGNEVSGGMESDMLADPTMNCTTM